MRLAVYALVAAIPCGCAPSPDPVTRLGAADAQCFYASDVSAYRAVSDRVIHLGTTRGQTVRLDTAGDCTRAQDGLTLAIRAYAGGDRICSPRDGEVVVVDASFPRQCPLASVRVLSEAEEAGLPREQRP